MSSDETSDEEAAEAGTAPAAEEPGEEGLLTRANALFGNFGM